MADEKAIDLILQVNQEGSDAEELDSLARQLAGELGEGDVESVGTLKAGTVPAGAKAVEAVTIGALSVAVLPTVLPKLVEFIQAWCLRGQGRTVKIKTTLQGQPLEFEGSSADLKTILAMLASQVPAPGPAEVGE